MAVATDAFEERLRAYEGRAAAVAGVGKDPVNEPMIRHWCEAMGDTSPAYAGPYAMAPPTMLQVWTMGGLSGHTDRSDAYDELLRLLDDSGYTSVVATDCEQEYLRPLRPGDEITFDAVIESVSARKTTKLGTGHFVTTRMDVRAGGEPAGTHRFRILKYAPARNRQPAETTRHRTGTTPQPSEMTRHRTVATRQPSESTQQRSDTTWHRTDTTPDQSDTTLDQSVMTSHRSDTTSHRTEVTQHRTEKTGQSTRVSRAKPGDRRPRPVINRDNAGFWEGVGRHELLIQRCDGCATLRFPWLPGCNACGCLEWDTVEASGDGTVYSYVVMHHPPFPAFDPPYAVGLIELSEGVRMVSNVVGVPYDKVRIGMPVRLGFQRYDDELELPVFRAGDTGDTDEARVDGGG
ncbi:bifunctional MaoC family dehydratase N-terminal/OB-fold nucleic acid binding domain-containing protein [Streptomyces sp. NPDC050535]|uniref:bifunctional MaoC family dehydratase N-terminal/OB-fold nucleic acid binding domain-containing protein n=1 Tax=Streptomyces sp. NPDC050535 TaxID=3365626 RepID=UPI0037BE0377